MTTFVLVHGAWHGGWCWRKLVPLLQAAGHRALTPTLTGLGERAHLTGPLVDLALHVEDLLAVFRWEELEDVVLVGHSYGGLLITAAADRIGEKIRSLVYLDAFVPRDGHSFMTLLATRAAEFYRARAAAQPEPWRAPPPSTRLLGLTDPQDEAWVKRLMVDQPLATLEQPVTLTRPDWVHPRRSYIFCSAPAIGGFERFAAQARREPGWRYHDLATGHDAMITAPEAVAALLLAEA